ncbi:hypothetical protein PAPYR_8971 [Paratrimastix pyriformis]|uniref:Uncharacterized protein n=1 Tax=Paratrimastix pyriformis TaxID=342808 RepID=A0ABQ8U9I0_9EUKA|nr:hypothetical protein PAPYR_8971 [Paratrimastix pyriformis]
MSSNLLTHQDFLRHFLVVKRHRRQHFKVGSQEVNFSFLTHETPLVSDGVTSGTQSTSSAPSKIKPPHHHHHRTTTAPPAMPLEPPLYSPPTLSPHISVPLDTELVPPSPGVLPAPRLPHLPPIPPNSGSLPPPRWCLAVSSPLLTPSTFGTATPPLGNHTAEQAVPLPGQCHHTHHPPQQPHQLPSPLM